MTGQLLLHPLDKLLPCRTAATCGTTAAIFTSASTSTSTSTSAKTVKFKGGDPMKEVRVSAVGAVGGAFTGEQEVFGKKVVVEILQKKEINIYN